MEPLAAVKLNEIMTTPRILIIIIVAALAVPLRGENSKEEKIYTDFVHALIDRKAPMFNGLDNRIKYEWSFLEHAVNVVSDDLLISYLEYFRERNLLRQARYDTNQISLDRPLAISFGTNWFFAWEFEPESIHISKIIKEGGQIIIEVEEKLLPSKIYSGYSGVMQLKIKNSGGKILLTNVYIERTFNDVKSQMDLKTVLSKRSDYMRELRLKNPEPLEEDPENRLKTILKNTGENKEPPPIHIASHQNK